MGKSSGISFFGLLGIVFITLKLCNVIDWSWWFVTLPLYGPIALVLGVMSGFFLFALFMFGLAGIVEHYQGKKRRSV